MIPRFYAVQYEPEDGLTADTAKEALQPQLVGMPSADISYEFYRDEAGVHWYRARVESAE